jgi:hypothetical protein
MFYTTTIHPARPAVHHTDSGHTCCGAPWHPACIYSRADTARAELFSSCTGSWKNLGEAEVPVTAAGAPLVSSSDPASDLTGIAPHGVCWKVNSEGVHHVRDLMLTYTYHGTTTSNASQILTDRSTHYQHC